MKWPSVSLGSVVNIKGGGTPDRRRPDFYRGEIPWATVKDLTDLYLTKTQERISHDALRSSAANLIPAGNVILATRVGLGKVALNTIDVAINQDLKALFCSEVLRPRFLLYYLASRAQEIEQAGVGATVRGITLEQVTNWKLPLPSPAEQERIIEILDQIDALRRRRAEADAKADLILPALFLKLFGDGTTNQMGWPTDVIENLAKLGGDSMRTGPFGSDLRHSEFVSSGIAVLGIDNVVQNRFVWAQRRYITPDKYSDLRRYRVFPNDVLVTIMGTTGRTAVVPDEIPEAITTKHLAAISVDRQRCEPEYLAAALLYDPYVSEQIRLANQGAIMPGLNLGIVRRLRVRVPPVGVQRRFVEGVQRVRALDGSRRIAAGRVHDLFRLLSGRAFRGKLTAGRRC